MSLRGICILVLLCVVCSSAGTPFAGALGDRVLPASAWFSCKGRGDLKVLLVNVLVSTFLFCWYKCSWWMHCDSAVFYRKCFSTVKPKESGLSLVCGSIKPSEKMIVLSWNDWHSWESHLSYKNPWIFSSRVVPTQWTHDVFPVGTNLWSFLVQFALTGLLAP